MLGGSKQFVDRGAFDDLAGIHHRDLVADFGDDAEVVGDQNDRRPARGLQLAHQSRICACKVTSSAVVGSSAINSMGSQANAIAIMTRWRIPPESLCGYSSMRRSGEGIWTRRNRSIARSRAVRRDPPR